MSGAALYEKVLQAKLRHVLLLEQRMISLLPRIRRGDEEARRAYEWYMQAAKAMSAKDLSGLGKLVAAEGEEDFDGFDED